MVSDDGTNTDTASSTVQIQDVPRSQNPLTRPKRRSIKKATSVIKEDGSSQRVPQKTKESIANKQPKILRAKKDKQDLDQSSRPALISRPLNFAPPAFQKLKGNLAKSTSTIEDDGEIILKKPRKPLTRSKQSQTTTIKDGTIGMQSASIISSSTTPQFAPTVDPFPSLECAPSKKIDIVTLGNDIDRVMKKVESQIQAAKTSETIRPLASTAQGTQRSGSNDQRQRNGRRLRPEREQLPSSLFENQRVTRGPYGRLQISASPKSVVDGLVTPVTESVPSRSQITQLQQYSTGPGLIAQQQRNLEADEALLEYQRKSSLNFTPPQAQAADEEAKTNIHISENRSGTDSKVASTESRTAPRRGFFEEHFEKIVALEGIKKGNLFQGPIRINQKARKDAWVTVSDKSFAGGDVLIEGEKNRNRALNGDVVIIALLQDAEHSQSLEQQERAAALDTENKQAQRDVQRGKVVHILRQRPLQRIAGMLRPPGWVIGAKKQDERTIIANAENKNSCVFHPQDQRIPWMIISLHDLPKALRGPNWIFNTLQKQNTIFAARIVTWQSHSRMPRGTIVDELGTIGSIEAETAAILADCDVDVRDHPASALLCLPETPWSISEEEVKKRRDFRKDRVCTIDPETARDLDDALSVRHLGNGNYEVGVHIADVSHFIQQGNPLDLIARNRATTVYMVQKAIPMLPRLLCEELCSLNPAVDRLAFSVTWTLDKDGLEVGPRWYGRSIIRSAVRFAYGEAQNLIDGQSWSEGVGKPVDGGHTEAEITEDILVLLNMSKQMRARRFENGALTMSAFKLNFKLNKDGLPGVAEVYQLRDANRLIEEFMLKANISVAEKIVETFPEHALLRMHPPPKEKPLKDFVSYARKLGIEIDASTSATMQEGFNKLAEIARDNPMVGVLQNNAVRSMQRAEYMCTGLHEDQESWAHYALAVPLYTHFTSPIRRYADVIVHRLLDRALNENSPGFEAEDCEDWAKNCNVRKENARTAQERSSMLYLCAYIEEHCRQHDCMGADMGMEVVAIVTAVRDRSIDVIVPSIALEKRLYYDDSYSIESFVHFPDDETTEISWRTSAQRLAAIKKNEDEADRVALNEASDGVRTSSRRTKTNLEKNVKSRGQPDLEELNTVRVTPAQVDQNEGIFEQLSDLSLAATDSATDNPREAAAEHTSTKLAVMNTIKIWLRADFGVSPCQINAGFVLPDHTPSTATSN